MEERSDEGKVGKGIEKREKGKEEEKNEGKIKGVNRSRVGNKGNILILGGNLF